MIFPIPELCLTRPYSRKRKQKGGTLINEGVSDRATHLDLLADPDGYRPESCPACRSRCLYAHGFRGRRLRGEPDRVSETVRRYLCVVCRAVWQVLPAFLARHLHRTWSTVRSALVENGVLQRTGDEGRISVPASTRHRWINRLGSSAVHLIQALTEAGDLKPEVVRSISRACRRYEFIEKLLSHSLLDAGFELSQLAGWLHRLVPGFRLV